jgi:hypothetical protein
MNAYELAEDIEFVAAHYIAIIGDIYLMDVAKMIKNQAAIIANQNTRIQQLEIELYGSR